MDVAKIMEQARQEMEWHDVAAVFPLMDEDALQILSDDIEREGLQEPVLTTIGEDGVEVVVDGRNRQMACIAAGVNPIYQRIDDDDDKMERDELASRIWSLNFARRHLTPSQLGMAAAEMRKYLSGTIPQAAAVTGASQRNTERACLLYTSDAADE